MVGFIVFLILFRGCLFLVRVVVECRHLNEVTLVLPCNWVFAGFCGVDARKCDIRVLERIS